MKKPFIVFKDKKDIFKLAVCVTLTFSAVCLFFLPNEAVTVFGDLNQNTPKSLFGLVSRWVN